MISWLVEGMSAFWRCLLLTTLLVGLLGCGSPSVVLEPSPRTFTPRDYERVYETWTRNADAFAFRRMSDLLHATATFEAWEFRWAYVIRYADDYGLDADARTEMLRATLQDASERHRFLVTVAAEHFRESDLSSVDSGWRVLLVDAHGRTVAASRIEAIRRPNATESRYFRSISPFRMAFRVTFPVRFPDGLPTISPDEPYFLLRFTGPGGSIDLRWDTQP